MLPSPEFLDLPVSFWSYVRTISALNDYAVKGEVLDYNQQQAIARLGDKGIAIDGLAPNEELRKRLAAYFAFRKRLLTSLVKTNLMDGAEAKETFEDYFGKHSLSRSPIPMNKAKGNKKHVNYLTGLVNLVTETTLGGYHFDGNPRSAAVMLNDNKPVSTMSRWLDGAFPNTVNPVAVWEVKEYYDNKSFGSRVADGVYETLLDGYELQALYVETGIKVQHYLILDSYSTWWGLGIPFLCRLVDAMHMGLVDEVIVGKEVLTRWPEIVRSWLPSK